MTQPLATLRHPVFGITRPLALLTQKIFLPCPFLLKNRCSLGLGYDPELCAVASAFVRESRAH
jgi:hypothetical protein